MTQPSPKTAMASNIDASSQHNNSNSDGHQGSPRQAAAVPTALPRAPVEPIATRFRERYQNLGSKSKRYTSVLLQNWQCVRSQREGREMEQGNSESVLFTGGILGGPHFISDMGFPYPETFLKALERQPAADVSDRGEQEMEIPTESNIEFSLPVVPRQTVFAYTSVKVADKIVPIQPTYVVLGIFRRGHPNPQERVVFVPKPEQLFRQLRWAVYRLRGLRGTFFSLKHVKGLRCDAEKGTHERVELDKNGVTDLQVLFYMCKKWHVSDSTSKVWADWIHQALNDGSNDVTKGTYALELVLSWSIARISIVVLLPVLLSLAIGIHLNAQNWTDLATIQTAWGTASYIVSTGGLLAALLAILSTIESE
ncbi:hypothetical protein FHL15_002718 [Xylaria flabelliformis]|uniref:Uncharacterized protein n=1 Tax=Xylaria flabelliformis TaxID=2512241 RepID=A0A553I8B6_9PEZI|nr:hypothetical protein FHL15_002718 [Xylaria flabelliformis]